MKRKEKSLTNIIAFCTDFHLTFLCTTVQMQVPSALTKQMSNITGTTHNNCLLQYNRNELKRWFFFVKTN